MRNSFKKITVWMLAATMILPLGSPTFSGVAYAADSVGVKVSVTDSSSAVRSVSSNELFKADTNTNPRLQGEAFAEISYTGAAASKLEYQFAQSAVGNVNALPADGWLEIPLNGSTENPDVMTDRPGNLNRRSYDVTMLPNISNIATWENRNNVYDKPFASSEIVPSTVAQTLAQYGSYVNYINYQGYERRRYNANTVFGALDGYRDMYPAADTVSIPGVDIAKYQESAKFWGYFKAPTSGNYFLGLVSDDGSTGTITVGGVQSKFSDGFKVQGSTWRSSGASVTLVKDKYYPLFLEYFNWGGGSRFQFYYTNAANGFNGVSNNTKVPQNAVLIPSNSLYPSKSETPGEYADTTFSGKSGVKLPSAPGDYYVLYKASNPNGVKVVTGCYGPFTVPGRAEVNLSKKPVHTDGSLVTNVQANVPFNIKYTIEPLDIPQNSILSAAGTQTIYLENVRIQDDLTSGFTVTKAAVPNEFQFSGSLTNLNNYTYVIPRIQYNLTVLENGQKVYRAVSSELNYSVSVKMTTPGTNVQISEDNLSIMTYIDPLDGADVSRKFNNGIISVLTPSSVVFINDPPTAIISNWTDSVVVDYDAMVYDQNKGEMPDKVIDYKIVGDAPVGVSIEKSTGKLTVTKDAAAGKVSIIATHGELVSSELSIVITKEAVAPTVTNVIITGTAEVGRTLTGSYTFTDLNGDAQGASIYKWYADGTLIPSANGTTLALTDALANRRIAFEVTPVSAVAPTTGVAVKSAQTDPVAALPVVSNVKVLGTPFVSGDVTGAYTYYDINGDLEGDSIYKWYTIERTVVNGVEVDKETLIKTSSKSLGNTLTLTPDQISKTIIFEVTPVSEKAPMTGAPVRSPGVSMLKIDLSGLKNESILYGIPGGKVSSKILITLPAATSAFSFDLTQGSLAGTISIKSIKLGSVVQAEKPFSVSGSTIASNPGTTLAAGTYEIVLETRIPTTASLNTHSQNLTNIRATAGWTGAGESVSYLIPYPQQLLSIKVVPAPKLN